MLCLVKLISKSVADTQKIAKILMEKITPKTVKRAATVLALEGELGAGKTVLVKALGRALGIKKPMTSPTFVLMKCYKLKTINYKLLYHIDAYRLKDHQDLEALGIKEILKEPGNLVLIEWAERVKKLVPKNAVWIHIDHIGDKVRGVIINEG